MILKGTSNKGTSRTRSCNQAYAFTTYELLGCNTCFPFSLPAQYEDHVGTFDFQLWEPKKGFFLNFLYEYSPRNDDYGEEMLAPSLTRYKEDTHFNQYYALLGN